MFCFGEGNKYLWLWRQIVSYYFIIPKHMLSFLKVDDTSLACCCIWTTSLRQWPSCPREAGRRLLLAYGMWMEEQYASSEHKPLFCSVPLSDSRMSQIESHANLELWRHKKTLANTVLSPQFWDFCLTDLINQKVDFSKLSAILYQSTWLHDFGIYFLCCVGSSRVLHAESKCVQCVHQEELPSMDAYM